MTANQSKWGRVVDFTYMYDMYNMKRTIKSDGSS